MDLECIKAMKQLLHCLLFYKMRYQFTTSIKACAKSLLNDIFVQFLDFQPRPATSKRIYPLRQNKKRLKLENTTKLLAKESKDLETSGSDTDSSIENEGKLLVILPGKAQKDCSFNAVNFMIIISLISKFLICFAISLQFLGSFFQYLYKTFSFL